MVALARWPTAAAVAVATAAAVVLASAWNRWRWRRLLLAETERQQALLPPAGASLEPGANPVVPEQEQSVQMVQDGKVLLHGAVCLARNTMTQYAVNPHSVIDERVVIAMVGLPARGKSYLSKAIVRYLNFVGCPSRLFNAGSRRRNAGLAGTGADFFSANNVDAAAQREEIAMETLDALLDWLKFLPNGSSSQLSKLEHNQAVGSRRGCVCGIFDATNTTVARRQKVRERCAREKPPVRLVFIESICTDEKLLMRNYKLKASNEDYAGSDPQAALADFLSRVRHYEAVYQTISDAEDMEVDEDEVRRRLDGDHRFSNGSPGTPRAVVSEANGSTAKIVRPPGTWAATVEGAAAAVAAKGEVPSPQCSSSSDRDSTASERVKREERRDAMQVLRYIQIIDAGRKLVACRTDGYVLSKVMALLHSIHLGPRTIWIALAGQTTNDERGILGGDTGLSHAGIVYSRAVCEFIARRERSKQLCEKGCAGHALVMTGTLKRYEQLTRILLEEYQPHTRTVLRLQRLNELCAGQLDSLSAGEMRKIFPREYEARAGDKLHYRYPGVGGESYLDLIMRLQEVILALEQQRTNVVLVVDRAVARVLIAYFQEVESAALPYMDVAPGVLEMTRSHSGFTCTHFDISVGLATTAAGPGAGPGYDRMLTHTLSSGRDTASSRSSLGMAGGMPAPLRYSPRAMHIERQSASDETYLRRE